MKNVISTALVQMCARALALALVMLGLAGWLAGQQSSLGSLTGTVTDTSGAVVPAAAVVVTNVATNASQRTVTTGVGSYTLAGLQPGEYTLTAERKGFKTATVTSVVVFAGRESTTNVRLEVGATSTNVTVTETAPLLNPNSVEEAYTMENAVLKNLPYAETDVLTALLAMPGFNGDIASPGGIVSENPVEWGSYTTPGFDIQVAGGRFGSQSYLVDGSDNTGTAYAREGMVFSSEDVQEVSVVTNGIPAQYGRSGGGVINVSTKSGTNAFHGSLQWRHSDPREQAYSLDSATGPALHDNFFGIYAGGPVYIPKVYDGRNKTWFFVDVEPSRVSEVGGFYGDAYTPDDLAGKFYNDLSLINTSVLAQSGAEAALAAPRVGAIWNQFPTNAQGYATGSRFASASQFTQIANDDLSAQLAGNPLAQFYVAAQPSPTHPSPYMTFLRPDGLWLPNGSNVWLTFATVDKNNRSGYRLDHQFSQNDHVFVRYGHEPLVGQKMSLYSNPLDSPSPWDYVDTNNASLNEVHTFSARMVNEFHASFLNTNFRRGPTTIEASKDWGPTLGLLPAVNGVGFPSIGTGDNAEGIGSTQLFTNIDQSVGLGDDITWSIGRHSLRLGIDLRRLQTDYYNQGGAYGGSYSFGSGTTNNGSTGGLGLASMILGELSSFSDTPRPVPEYYRYHYYAGYLQDDFKLRSNLTLNLGLRWEFETPRTEKYNEQGTFLPSVTGTLNGQPVTGGFCFSGSCGLGRGLWPSNYRGFGPRLGLAYSPMKFWTIRASYGLMRAPMTGVFGYGNYPDFNVSGSPVGGQYGGTDPNAWVNTMTNPPVEPTGGFPYLKGGPYFTMYPVSVPYVPQTSAVPYVQNWEFDMQFQLNRNDMLEVAYVGNHGAHLFGQNGNGSYGKGINMPSLATVTALGEANHDFTTLTPNPYGIATSTGGLISESVMQSLAPYPNFFYDNIAELGERDYDSEYDALYLTWTHRTAYGVAFLGSFTWDKLLDDATEVNSSASIFGGGYGDFQNPYNLKAEKSQSVDELPTKFALGASYQLPVGKGKRLAPGNRVLNEVVGDWVTSGMFQSWGGNPVDLHSGNSGYFFSVSPSDQSLGTYLPGLLQPPS